MEGSFNCSCLEYAGEHSDEEIEEGEGEEHIAQYPYDELHCGVLSCGRIEGVCRIAKDNVESNGQTLVEGYLLSRIVVARQTVRESPHEGEDQDEE